MAEVRASGALSARNIVQDTLTIIGNVVGRGLGVEQHVALAVADDGAEANDE